MIDENLVKKFRVTVAYAPTLSYLLLTLRKFITFCLKLG